MQTPSNASLPPTQVGNYTLLSHELLGRGATGSVYKGVHNHTKKSVAIKVIDLATINDDATKSLLDNQKLGLKTVSDPNVLKLEDIIEDGRFCFIITELCEGKTLKEYLAEKHKLEEVEAMAIFKKLTEGAMSISGQCMIHRDLKPANVMIDQKGEIKIIDFGYCEIFMAKKVMKTFNVGSPAYMSPEAYQRTLYSEKSDAWALAITLYQMLHGQTLDSGMDIKQYFEELKNDPSFVEKKISPSVSLEIKEGLIKALKFTPEERSSISGLKFIADKFHVKLRQNNTNVTHQMQPMTPMINQTPRFKVGFYEDVRSLNRIDSENNIIPQRFVSYRDFTKATQSKPMEHKINGPHMMKMKPMTSLEDFDATSAKAASVTSKGVAINPKLTTFMQNNVKQQPRSIKSNRPSSASSNNTPIVCRNTNFISANFIPHSQVVSQVPLQHQPPLYRHVTVRYS